MESRKSVSIGWDYDLLPDGTWAYVVLKLVSFYGIHEKIFHNQWGPVAISNELLLV